VRNLFTNAIKYSPNDSAINITTAIQSHSKKGIGIPDTEFSSPSFLLGELATQLLSKRY